ncbi:hypothetical protein RND81_03G213100 [Saponaria officinalis]
MESGKVNGGSTVSVIPTPIFGPNGGFQFHLGPFGYTGTWNFGLLPPGSFIAYSQPMLMSSYSPPTSSIPLTSATHSPHTNVQLYQHQPGAFVPFPQYYFASPFGQYPWGAASEHK